MTPKSPTRDFVSTPYGDLDPKRLARLRASFESSQLLSMVEVMDDLRQRFKGRDGLRNQTLKLHAMVLGLMDERIAASFDEDITEVALALSAEILEMSRILADVATMIEPLTMLSPDQ